MDLAMSLLSQLGPLQILKMRLSERSDVTFTDDVYLQVLLNTCSNWLYRMNEFMWIMYILFSGRLLCWKY